MTNAAHKADLVGLETLARPAPVSEPPSRQFAPDLVASYRQSGRETLDDGYERTPVGLARGEKAQHSISLRRVGRAGSEHGAMAHL